jgi:long-chain acyl-CoA synthetase
MLLVRDEGPIFFSGVPTMYTALNSSGADLRAYGFHRIRTFNSGGSPLPVNAKRAFEAQTGRPLFEGYGLSEASPVTHFNPPFTGEAREGSIGVPIPSTDARIVDVETGTREMPVGDPGELVIQGAAGHEGLLEHARGDGRSPARRLAPHRRRGAHGRDGYFYVVDRKKDMISAGGYNVYPREIEEVLYEHEEIAEAVAIGVEDEYRGETVKAFVVRKSGNEVTKKRSWPSARNASPPTRPRKRSSSATSCPRAPSASS